MNTRFRAGLAAALSTLGMGALAAPAAQASLLSLDPSSCGTQTLSKPFAPWLDVASYTLAPGGSFESGGPSWTQTGGAAVQHANESFYVHGTADTQSLALPPGSSATSPAVCTNIYQPSIRYFVRNTGSALSSLKVDVIYPGLLGKLTVAQLGIISGSSKWTASLPTIVLPSLISTLPGSSTSLAFRFTPQGSAGSWSIDDVYVDPYRRN